MSRQRIDRLTVRAAAGERLKFLFFWGHTKRPGDVGPECLSQFYAAPFTVEGDDYPTAEHFMMASKAALFDPDVRPRILEAEHPKKAKSLGRTIENFDESVWLAHRQQIVTVGNLAKFSQNAELGGFLASTGDQILVEASPNDRIWGNGLKADHPHATHPANWKGQNLLGFTLMDVREQLRTQ